MFTVVSMKLFRFLVRSDAPAGGGRRRRAEEIGIHAFRLRFLACHQAARNQVGQRHVHGLHAVFLAHLHGAGNLMDLAFANKIPHRGGAGQDLQRRHSSAGFLLEQSLRNHRFDGFGELGANLRLLSGRKNVDDTIDGLGRARSMQCAEDDMTGFRGSQSELNGFQVAHFADQNDIGIFTQRGAQRIGERMSVRPQLALVDQTFFGLVDELDGIFDG